MQPSGMTHVMAAKKDGRWAAAYEPASTIKVPQEFLDILKTDKEAEEFFKTLTKAQCYTIAFQITTAAKQETKKRRIQKYFELMQNQQKP